MTATVRRVALACLRPLLAQAARAYVAGDTLDAALEVRARLAAERIATTLGFFNAVDDSPERVADEYLHALGVLGRGGDRLAIKAPALAFDERLLAAVAARAVSSRVRLHLDAHAIEHADATFAVAARWLRWRPPEAIGVTLPGRWPRSLEDVEWPIRRGVAVRVVKGQWPDPQQPAHDATVGTLAVVDLLAGRASEVAIASHDPAVVGPALTRLLVAGTRCELELLYGLPMRAASNIASRLGVPIRIYVPYGVAHLPYAVGRVLDQPYLLRWLLRDLAGRWPRQGQIARPVPAQH